jgi:hypothetical protein
MLDLKPTGKVAYIVLSIFLGIGSFGLFSEMDVNLFVKTYGLLVCLQAGFAMVYFGVYRKSRCSKERSRYS